MLCTLWLNLVVVVVVCILTFDIVVVVVVGCPCLLAGSIVGHVRLCLDESVHAFRKNVHFDGVVAQSHGKRFFWATLLVLVGVFSLFNQEKIKTKTQVPILSSAFFWATLLVLVGVFSLFKLDTNRCRALVWCFGMFYMPTSTSAGRCAVCVCFVMLVVCPLLICFFFFLVANDVLQVQAAIGSVALDVVKQGEVSAVLHSILIGNSVSSWL